jgi:hypothetical protein
MSRLVLLQSYLLARTVSTEMKSRYDSGLRHPAFKDNFLQIMVFQDVSAA